MTVSSMVKAANHPPNPPLRKRGRSPDPPPLTKGGLGGGLPSCHIGTAGLSSSDRSSGPFAPRPPLQGGSGMKRALFVVFLGVCAFLGGAAVLSIASRFESQAAADSQPREASGPLPAAGS